MTSDQSLLLEPRRASLFQCEELSVGGEAFARLPIRQRVLGWASGQTNAHVPACVFPQAAIVWRHNRTQSEEVELPWVS